MAKNNEDNGGFAEDILSKAHEEAQHEETPETDIDELENDPDEEETPGDILDDILDDHYANAPEEEPEEEAEEDDEPEFHFEGEEKARKGEQIFEGINIADIITAEMAIQYYENFLVKICLGISKIMKTKRKIHEDEIRVSSDIKEISANLLNVYWKVVKIKIPPVLGTFALMTGAVIYNFMDALGRDEDIYQQQTRQQRKPNAAAPENVVDVSYEDVTDQDQEVDEDLQRIIDEETRKIEEELAKEQEGNE